MWLEIKLTAIKNEAASKTEYFLFDLSQKNLYLSVKEVLASVDGHLDLVNSLILKEFLLDLIRNEFLNNVASDFITEHRLEKFQFIYDQNFAYKQYFKSLKKNELECSIFKLMEVTQVLYDTPSSVLKVLELQKLSLQSDLNEMFSTVYSKQSANHLTVIERNLDKIMKQREISFTDSRGSCLSRVEACECSIF